MDKNVSIIGTGDYACALAKNLLRAGYNVYCGSRDPNNRHLAAIDKTLVDVKVVSHVECAKASDVVFLCVHVESCEVIIESLQQVLKEKIVIDVSNPLSTVTVISNAEKLQKLIPDSYVIKAFNTVSANTIVSDTPNCQKEVLICGNNQVSKLRVESLARDMGFSVSSCGGLGHALELENKPLFLFRGWGVPTLITIGVFLAWACWAIPRNHIFHGRPWEDVVVYTLNQVLACSALTLLALCFLPGALASFLQIYYGTKQKRFPTWLDRWLKARKQLGLYALLLASIHACYSLVLFQPGYFSRIFSHYTSIVPANSTEDVKVIIRPTMTLKGNGTIFFGVLALAAMSILGITSIPAVGNLLNWKEWRFVLSHLGYFCLFLASGHVIAYHHWSVKHHSAKAVFFSMSFVSLVLPFITLFLKLILSIPCVNKYVWKIRRGYERKGNTSIENGFPNLAYEDDIPMNERENNGTPVANVVKEEL